MFGSEGCLGVREGSGSGKVRGGRNFRARARRDGA